MRIPMSKKFAAEFIGTFWLVLGGCGSAVLAAAFPEVGIGLAGVALAFGLTVLTMAYAIGHISGCHLNPAVTIGLWAGGRHPVGEVLPYVVAQVLGGIAGAFILYMIASGQPGFDLSGGLASNGYGEHSPGGYSMVSSLVTEVVITAFFLIVIVLAPSKKAAGGFAPIAIDKALLQARCERAAAMLQEAQETITLRLSPQDIARLDPEFAACWTIAPDPDLPQGELRAEGRDGAVLDGPREWSRALAEALETC